MPTTPQLLAPLAVALALAGATPAWAQSAVPGTHLVLSESFEVPSTSNYTVVRAGQSFRARNHVWQVEQASIQEGEMGTNKMLRREMGFNREAGCQCAAKEAALDLFKKCAGRER